MASSFPLGIDRAGAITRIERYLTGTFDARRLERPRTGFSDAWRLESEIAGRRLGLNVEIPNEFPRKLPHIFVVDPPPFPTWPHVEASGLLCVASPKERYDRARPQEVVQALLEGALDILEQGITGANAEEFRSEFLPYWNHAARAIGNCSLLDPSGPSRSIKIWRGKGRQLIAESNREIRAWLANRGKARVADSMIEDAALLWFERPLLPTEYPKTAQDVFDLAAQADGDGVGLLERLLKNARSRIVSVIIGADAGNGVCFGEIELQLHQFGRSRRLERAHLPGSASAEVRLGQWKVGSIARGRVERVDAFWIHGRDSNNDLLTLRTAKVAVVGCGSLGSQVARLLALAGVADLRLIDDESLDWANIGRHVLGADCYGQNKASALAKQLSREFPHSQFIGHPSRWQESQQAFDQSDLIVSTIGELDEEAELMLWQREHPGSAFVFAWTEPRACASQAIAVMRGSGCLLCGFDHLGDPEFRATKWEELPLRREAACGGWFMPYGADEIMSAAILTADLALDVLTERAQPGAHRVSSARTAIVELAGGEWSDAWRATIETGDPGGRLAEGVWAPNIHCPVCGGAGPA